MAPQGLICPKMEKYGDISVKKCDFIEVYPRFLVHSTKNLYKEKTGTRAGIWEKSVCKHTAKETSDRELVETPFRRKELRTFACFPFHSCQLNGLHCPENPFSFLAVQKFIELCQLVNPPVHWRINDVNPPASYLLLTYYLSFMIWL